jgi:uncharacterized membrane protein
MFSISSVPTWDALHPAIAHFPIALLVVAPLFVLLALLMPTQRRTLMMVGFGLLAAGTVAVYISASTGDEAKITAPQAPEITAAIQRHEDLASMVRAISTALTVLLGAVLFVPRLVRRELGSRAYATAMVAFFAVSIASVVLVAGTAHSGGLLVHKLGVHARIR